MSYHGVYLSGDHRFSFLWSVFRKCQYTIALTVGSATPGLDDRREQFLVRGITGDDAREPLHPQ